MKQPSMVSTSILSFKRPYLKNRPTMKQKLFQEEQRGFEMLGIQNFAGVKLSESGSTPYRSQELKMNNVEGSTSSNAMISNSRSDFPFDLAISYIDHALSPFTNEGSPCQIRTKLRDIMAPIASDFSQICDGISEVSIMFSSEESTRSLSG
ncbi:hypothetical protein SUGI_0702320 [Cryptomeria japonica]|nr:hypothetical protein SUGI_0702320 [Cryptomeria japonica]